MPIDLHLRLDPRHLRTFILALFAVEILFVVAHLALFALAPESGLRHMFNLDKEYNFPSYFSAMQLFLVGLVLMLLAPLTVGREQVPSWFLILGGLGFVFLSADEMLSLHERLTRNLATLSWTPRFRDDHGIWIFVYAALLPVILLVVWRPLRALWRMRRPAIVVGLVGVAVFVTGAVVVEIPSYVFALRETTGWIYPAQVAVEEFLEMVGATIILFSAFRICLDGAKARTMVPATSEAGGSSHQVAAATV